MSALIVTFTFTQTAKVNAQKTTNDDLLFRAESLIRQGQSEEALKIVQTAADQNPGDAALNFWVGRTYYRQGRYQSAVHRLAAVVDKLKRDAPEYTETVRMLGMGHYVLGHLAESIPYLEQISAAASSSREITYALGVAYIQTRQPAKSRHAYARLFDLPPNSAAAYLLNAQMHQRQRFEETAEIELQQALKLDPRLPQVNFVLGELAIYRAELDKGIEYLKKEIALNPSDDMAYYRWGEALSRQLKWDEAIGPLQKSIWLNPSFSGPYIVLGKVYLKKGDLITAENMLRRSTAMDPNNFGAHHLLAQVLQQAGKMEEAKAEFALSEKLRGSGEKDP